MRRRDFIMVLGGAAATWPLAAHAQQQAKMKRIAIVSPALKIGDIGLNGSRPYRIFFEELRRLGFDEGRNLLVERYSGEGRGERYAELARDVVNTHPDLIYSQTHRFALLFKAATATIPIVTTTGDPLAGGLVSSLARPGGNITGVSVVGTDVVGKRLALLLEATSKLSNARYLVSQRSWDEGSGVAVREASRRLGILLAGEPMSSFSEQEYQRLFTSMEHAQVDGILVSDEAEHFTYRELLVELAARARIPAMYAYREPVELGGLMAYSIDLAEVFRGNASQVAEILRGANPGDVPFRQATKFQLVINVRAAKALRLEMPSALLLRADEVIE